jgi:hypothetical protein
VVEIIMSGEWYLVRQDGVDLAMFVSSLDAHRFAIAMLHDGLAGSVTHQNGAMVEP